MKFLVRIIINAIAIFALAEIMSGIQIENATAALIVGFVLILLNTFVRPILVILTFPITIVTLGLFLLVINAAIVLLADSLVEGFEVASFWWALLFSIIMMIINSLIDGDKD